MKFNIKLIFFTLLVSISCCKSQNKNKQLSFEFYKLNKNKDLTGLFDLRNDNRFDSVFDTLSEKNILIFDHFFLYDEQQSDYKYLPIFRYNAPNREKKTAYQKCGNMTKNYLQKKLGAQDTSELFKLYSTYIDLIMHNYNAITTPSFYNNKNVKIDGNPRLGNFITFELNDKTKCFYVKDKSNMDPFWLKFFNADRRFDEHWYYDISK